MNDDRALLSWLMRLEEEGLVLIDDVPTDRGQLHLLTIRVAYMRTTGWGYAVHTVHFGLKSGGTKLEAPKTPRIEMPKASRG